jgi:hypothetical protein
MMVLIFGIILAFKTGIIDDIINNVVKVKFR